MHDMIPAIMLFAVEKELALDRNYLRPRVGRAIKTLDIRLANDAVDPTAQSQ